MGKLFTTESAASFLGVTPARVRQLILEERLPSEKYGRDHLIAEVSLQHFKKNGRQKVGRPRKKRLARALE
jgi:site-specific DNA-methyltransferase (adenine-specific)